MPLYKSDFGPLEKAALLDAFERKWFSTGAITEEFEKRFAEYLGGETEAVALTNCTAALHLSLMILGIGPGDEVIIPSMTFVADLNVVCMLGATPVAVDAVSENDWNMSPEDLEQKIGPRTKAIIAVHYAGYPFSGEILRIAENAKIPLIEDAAHAIGASKNGAMCGTWGCMSAFSFYANKNLAIGEGGMLVTSNKELARRARLLRTHGMTSIGHERFSGTGVSYDIEEPGLNYRLDDLRASLGLVQLSRLNENQAKREEIVRRYRELLGQTNFTIPFTPVSAEDDPAYHIFPVLLPTGTNRSRFMEKMKGAKIQTGIHYPAFSNFSYFRDKFQFKTPTAGSISARVVTLPLYPAMTPEQADLVAQEAIAALRF